MNIKKIAPVLVLGGLAYMASQGDKEPKVTPPPPPPPPTNTDNTNANTGSGGLQTAGGSSGMIAVSGIDASSQPNYKDWNRSHWAAWYQNLLQTNSPADAKAIVWAAWTNPENPFANYKEHQDKPAINKMPNADILVFSLATFRPETAVGVISVNENSLPVYDTWSAWWNGATVWNCPEWKNWFDAMEAAWGRQTAQQKFASAWSYKDNWAFGSNAWDCSQTCDFIDDMTQRGVDVADTGMRTLCNLTNIPYNIVTAGSNVSQGINDATSAAAGVAPLLVYGGVAFLAYKAYQSINE